MRLTEITYDTAPPIDGYGPGFFRIGGEVQEGAVLLLPGSLLPWAGYAEPEPLIGAVGEIDVLFFGTGADIAHIPSGLRSTFEDAGLGLELMATPT
ncbi:MAG: hypothetical protein HKP40_11570, partial [Litoreibacter sp.]|nr:hypothetical protein [Litoreibacter sp.]